MVESAGDCGGRNHAELNYGLKLKSQINLRGNHSTLVIAWATDQQVKHLSCIWGVIHDQIYDLVSLGICQGICQGIGGTI